MKRFLLYGHGGAYNHGAEAIVKCTAGLLKKRYPDSTVILSTHFKEQDIEFCIPVDEYCERNLEAVDKDKVAPIKGMYDKQIYLPTINRITENTVCLSVGGDNYCYDNWRKWKVLHEAARECGALSLLWSCSIEPAMMSDEMVETLKTHDLITARESITFNALKEKGLNNVIPCSDIAFLLEPKECLIPSNFRVGNTVAINLSPLVIRRERSAGIIFSNIMKLIDLIIEQTDMSIALIPHVLMPMDNDLQLLKEIYRNADQKERICLVDEHLSAAEYKYIISKCRFGVFARTHASIAAYSSHIPSIVLGYSVKSRGIATDLGIEDYVLPLESIDENVILPSLFKKLMCNEHNIKMLLSEKIPLYHKAAEIDLSFL